MLVGFESGKGNVFPVAVFFATSTFPSRSVTSKTLAVSLESTLNLVPVAVISKSPVSTIKGCDLSDSTSKYPSPLSKTFLSLPNFSGYFRLLPEFSHTVVPSSRLMLALVRGLR
jgi:hypothetical protein